MKKKGFTLVELLAVIAILAILVIIALPNVLGMFQSAKKNTFTTELQNIYKSATTQYVSDSMNRGAGSGATGLIYMRSKDNDNKATSCGSKRALDLSGTETIEYYIEFDLSGNVVRYVATDGEFVFWFDSYNESESITKGLGDYSGMQKLAIEDIGSNVKVYTIADEQKNAPVLAAALRIYSPVAGHYYHIYFSDTPATSDGICDGVINISAYSSDTDNPSAEIVNYDYVPPAA